LVLYISVGYKYGIKEISRGITEIDACFEKTGFGTYIKLIQISCKTDFLNIFADNVIIL
jgi:hypothetical protein